MKSKNFTIPFFFRRINDLEQYLPIVEHFIKKNYLILLICINDEFEIDKFEKLSRYKNNKNIKVDYLYNFLYHKKFFTRVIFILSRKYIFFRKIKNFLLKNKKDENYFQYFLNKYKVKTAVFDFPITNLNYLKLISNLKNYGVRIFGIHHGIWVRDNNLKNKMIKKIFLKNDVDANHYDKILTFSKDYFEIMSNFNNGKKFLNFGIISKNKFKIADLSKQNKIIRILYLDHSAKHGIIKSKVIKDLVAIKKISNLKLTIRPNTSIEFVKNKEDLDIFKKYDLKNNISYELTEKLIQKHDIIINPISSVIIKAYFYGKIVIHPAHYIPKDKMVWQRFRSCFEIKSTKDLKNLIQKYKSKELNLKKYNENSLKMYNYLIGNNDHLKKLKNIEDAIIKN